MKLKSILTMIYTAIIMIVVFSFTITFMQSPFIQQTASLKFLFWQTPEYPMIYFVVVAGITGLLTGLFIAVIDSFQKGKIIRELKKELKEIREKIEEKSETESEDYL